MCKECDKSLEDYMNKVNTLRIDFEKGTLKARQELKKNQKECRCNTRLSPVMNIGTRKWG